MTKVWILNYGKVFNMPQLLDSNGDTLDIISIEVDQPIESRIRVLEREREENWWTFDTFAEAKTCALDRWVTEIEAHHVGEIRKAEESIEEAHKAIEVLKNRLETVRKNRQRLEDIRE